MRGTRGVNILAGLILILILMTVGSVVLKFEVIAWMLKGFWTIFAITLIVIFQPELRRALARIGQNAAFRSMAKRGIMTKLGYNVVFLLEKCHPNTIDDIKEIIRTEINNKKELIENVFKLD